MRTISGEGLVDTVVHYLVHKMVKSPLPDIAYIHGRPFPHGFKPFQDLYTIGGILILFVIGIFAHTIMTIKRTKLTILSQIQADSGRKIDSALGIHRHPLDRHAEQIPAPQPE